MYILIVDGGTEAEKLAEVLIAEKHNVAVVEKDEERATELADKLDALIIKGEGTEMDILKDAGINKADVVVAMTEDDKVNLMVTEIAKKENIKSIAARVNDPENESLYLQAGASMAISATEAIITTFKNAITSPGEKSILIIANGQIQVLEIYIPKDSSLHKKKIEEVGIDDKHSIISIDRNGEGIIPMPDTVLMGGDIIYVAVRSDAVVEIYKRLTK
jgi:trk system potassium uptake protein TrkA